MIGADIRDADNHLIGTVAGFFDFGAGEMIEAELWRKACHAPLSG